jgi:hypothetical protein
LSAVHNPLGSELRKCPPSVAAATLGATGPKAFSKVMPGEFAF